MSARRSRLNRLCGVALLVPALLAIPARIRAESAASDECLQRIEIASGWSIKSINPRAELDALFLEEAARTPESGGWLDAGSMPATVHDILLRLGKIEAPWLPHGTEKCFWVGQQDWVYSVRFAIEDQGGEARMRFMGIENKVDVYLNGKRLASHANQLPLVVDVSGLLNTENVLVLHCHADFRSDEGQRRERGSYLGPNPSISSVGVFDQVFVEISEGARFDEVVANAALDEALTQGTVTVDVAGESRLASATLRTRLLDSDGACVAEASDSVTVTDGEFSRRSVLQIDRPRLWWPRGYGDQPLYRAEVALVAEGRVQEIAYRTVGFRRVINSEPLHFVVNGAPVFLRGGNWVTPNLMSDVWDTARVDRLFALAENANFNAFRVWGPAEAPPDAFYEQADARGFLLWQDFTRLPMRSDSKSIATCSEKARAMIKRLKHHPSILCWCACNEAAQWAHEDYNKDFKDHGPWGGLAAAEAVGAICKELDPARYLPTQQSLRRHESQRSAKGQYARLHQHVVCAGVRLFEFCQRRHTHLGSCAAQPPAIHGSRGALARRLRHALSARQPTPFSGNLDALYVRRKLEEDRAGRAVL